MNDAESFGADNGLNRDMLTQGIVQKMVDKRDGDRSTALSLEALKLSRQRFLPDDYSGPDIWVFGYGSLIWNPLIRFEEKHYGRVYGYHKRFCLWTYIGRGNHDCPGLVLALDNGGSVRGCIFKIKAKNACDELDILWRREMMNNSYLPKWVTVHKKDSPPVKALSFVIRHDGPGFAERMSDERISQHIASAHGFVGPCSEYLFETAGALQAEGMSDHHMNHLVELVKSRQKIRK